MPRRLAHQALCFFVALLLLLGPGLDAADGPKVLDPDTAAFVIEDSQITVTVQPDGRAVQEHRLRVRVGSDAGVRALAMLQYPFTKTSQAMDLVYVRVTKPDGAIVETPTGDAQEVAPDIARSAPVYTDLRVKQLVVKGLGVGDLLETKVALHITEPEIPNHYVTAFDRAPNIPYLKGTFVIDAPTSMGIRVTSTEGKLRTETKNDRTVFRIDLANQGALEQPALSMSLAPLPLLQASSFADWAAVGAWYTALSRAASDPTDAIRARAEQVTRGIEGDEAKIRALYEHVGLGIHYVQLAFGIGRYRPNTASEVLANNYGDCKDKAVLLTALLRASGYDASYALVMLGREVDPTMPSPTQFNHLISVVQLGERQIWLDTTPEVAPFGLLLGPLRETRALLVPPNAAATLVTTPAGPTFDAHLRYSIDAKLDDEGTLRARISLALRDDQEVAFRSLFRAQPRSAWDNLVKAVAQNYGLGGELSKIEVSDPADLRAPFTVAFDYEREDIGDWDNKRFPAPMLPIPVNIDRSTPVPTRPVRWTGPVRWAYSARIELPAGYTLRPPPNLDLTEPFATYRSNYSLEGSVLRLERVFVGIANEVPLTEWEKVRAFGIAIGEERRRFLTLLPTEAAR